jgi:hypothetical protein
MAGAGSLRHVRDALQVEVAANTQGIKAALEKGMTKVILDSGDRLNDPEACTKQRHV